MITALGPRLGLGLRLDFGSQVWFVQYFSEKKVIVLCQAIFVRFLFEVCWLLSFFSPKVPVQGELVRARGFRSRAFNSALARLAGCRARGGLPTRAPQPDDSRQVSGFAVAPLSWLCV